MLFLDDLEIEEKETRHSPNLLPNETRLGSAVLEIIILSSFNLCERTLNKMYDYLATVVKTIARKYNCKNFHPKRKYIPVSGLSSNGKRNLSVPSRNQITCKQI